MPWGFPLFLIAAAPESSSRAEQACTEKQHTGRLRNRFDNLTTSQAYLSDILKDSAVDGR
jgi:hypothetical protein